MRASSGAVTTTSCSYAAQVPPVSRSGPTVHRAQPVRSLVIATARRPAAASVSIRRRCKVNVRGSRLRTRASPSSGPSRMTERICGHHWSYRSGSARTANTRSGGAATRQRCVKVNRASGIGKCAFAREVFRCERGICGIGRKVCDQWPASCQDRPTPTLTSSGTSIATAAPISRRTNASTAAASPGATSTTSSSWT